MGATTTTQPDAAWGHAKAAGEVWEAWGMQKEGALAVEKGRLRLKEKG